MNKKLALHWKILIGMALGVLAGIAANQYWGADMWASHGVGDAGAYIAGGSAARAAAEEGGANTNADTIAGVGRLVRHANDFVGDLFMRGLRFIAVPIVLFSLIVGVSSLNDTSKLGRIGGKTIGIYLVTTAVAITVGLVLANIVGPGRGFSEETGAQLAATQQLSAESRIGAANMQRDRSTWEILLEIVPTNPFASMAQGNTLQVVVAALLIGVALTLVKKETARPVVQFCEGMTQVIIKIVEMILKIAPYAVFALISRAITDLGIDVLEALAWYVMTVVTGLAVMMFGVYPAVLRLFGGVGPRRFFRAISPAQLLAFSSSSSGATLPVTMECCEQRLGIKEEVSSFVLPIGATVNMDGTALYQGVAAVFIAQFYGLDLTIGDQVTIVLTATLASIGTAAVPGVGIVMLVIVLESVGIPLEGIAVILGVDRILDMCRTSCNVTGDCMVATVVASSEGALMTESEVDSRRVVLEAGLDEHPHEPGEDQ